MPLLFVSTSPAFNTRCGVHSHESYEIILNTEGDGISVIGDREYPFTRGTIHIVPPDVPHYKYSSVNFRDIYLQADCLTPVIEKAMSRGDGMCPLILQDDAEGSMEKLMYMLFARRMKSEREDAVLETLFSGLLLMIGEACLETDQRDKAVEQLEEVFLNHFTDPEFSVSEALEATPYCRDHMRRRFYAVHHMTPTDYVTGLRMRYAVQLLKVQDKLHLTIADIAYMCGYYDARYFSRVFKKTTGILPSEYAGKDLMK